MTAKKLIYLLLLALVAHSGATAQQVTFGSAEIALGVRMHLGLDSTAVVQQAQTDTITGIDLSRLGIDDLRDIVYLPNVKYLNLAYNKITDVGPLTQLDSLRYLDLRANKIRDIDLMALSTSDSMEMNVAYNYITDFGRLHLPTHCKFQIAGRHAQTDPEAPYIHINDMHVGTIGRSQRVYYRGDGNQPEAYLTFGGKHVAVTLDSVMHEAAVPGTFREPGWVWLRSDDAVGDSIWVIPCRNHKAEAGATVTIDTQLPFGYSIYYPHAMHGQVTVTGSVITYKAPANPMPDEIGFIYYQGLDLRGFGKLLINHGLRGDVDGSGIVDVDDVNAMINIILEIKRASEYPGSADLNESRIVDVDDVNILINIILGIE